jgi:hypothetical protein
MLLFLQKQCDSDSGFSPSEKYPIQLWKAFKTHAPFSELSEFAITLLE